MTRTLSRRPHGHKRKGKPVEAWKKELQQDENSEDVRIRGVNLNTIEQIANGVERMMSSWHLETFERGQKQAKIFNATKNPETLILPGDEEVSQHVPLIRESSVSCSIVETRAAFEAPILRENITMRNDHAACEKGVGTEAMTPSPDSAILLPSPRQRNCCPGTENSCSYASSVATHLSPRNEEPHDPNLTHSFPDFCHLRDPGLHFEARAGVDKATHIDTVAGAAAAHALTPKNHGIYNHGPPCGAFSPSSCYYWPCRIETLEVGGRPVTMPALRNCTDALRNKFESLINLTSSAPLLQERLCSVPPEISSVEELQLALIECATEYEIQMTSTPTKISQSQYALQRLRTREVMKPEKLATQTATQSWKKKERLSLEPKKSESGIRAFSRLFERQKRSLDDALDHVDRLQRQVSKKDRELVEWQLKEKETKTQMLELEDMVKKTPIMQASPRLEPRKVFLALPALRALKSDEKIKIRSPLTETTQELANMENKSLRGPDCALHNRLQCLENRASDVDELKATMSKLAANMAELSMAFNDHVQFVNHRLGTIHGYVMKKGITASGPELASNQSTVGQLTVETVEAEREIHLSTSPY